MVCETFTIYNRCLVRTKMPPAFQHTPDLYTASMCGDWVTTNLIPKLSCLGKSLGMRLGHN